VENSIAINGATPHRLVSMLFAGAIERIVAARGAAGAGKIKDKAEKLRSAMFIVDGLRLSLDKERGGEIAENLERLYEYMNRRLLEANLTSDEKIFNEVLDLLDQIYSAWRAIEGEVSQGELEATAT
jgi:flagellar protein FliS